MNFGRKIEEFKASNEEPILLPAEDGYGYYPSARVGTRIGPYQIVRKLGWSSSSSVWLCVDTSTPDNTYVAIKILSAHESERIVAGLSPELDLFQLLTSTNPSHPGLPYCLSTRKCFRTRSIAGGHICFVTGVLGSNMRTLRFAQPNRVFPIFVVKRIIKQLLMGLDYLHTECRHVHTDIKAHNVLAVLPKSIELQIDEYLRDNPTIYCSHKQHFRTFKSQPLPDFNLDLRKLRVCLIDYGAASDIDKPLHDEIYEPDILSAPEVILGYSWSTAVDIWSIGCLMFEFITNCQLFSQVGAYSPAFHIQNMVECLGALPPRFLNACSRRAEYFKENGSFLRVRDFRPNSLERMLRCTGAVDAKEIPIIAAFMYRCLTLDPLARSTAQDLLTDVWLADV